VTDYAAIFEAMTADARYVANLDWGEPRPGHPEGTVRAHITELESNLDSWRPLLTDEECWKLKLLIHCHDTFKAESQPGVAITHPRSHASIARSFLATHCDDPDLLAMLQFHDEPFALYRQAEKKGAYDADRFTSLLTAIRDWDLFLVFAIIDGCTAGKSREPLDWLFRDVGGKVQFRFTAANILR
jgi:hypothetical protein